MISCRGVSKKYNNQTIFSDFSYDFSSTGFYLLFGESGSGKTTLLNMLAGHMAYDDGSINIGGKDYKKQVDAKEISSQIDYITQDPNFIDYLSVYDNLFLCSKDEAVIDKYLEKFNLADKRDMLPGKLSGGEKQRVCLIRSLIQHKRVILLDEPTASLDKKNKILVFEILKELKDEVLIICSSHDEVSKEYADKYIDFNCLDKYIEKNDCDEVGASVTALLADEMKEKRRVSSYVRKWFKSSYKEKGSRIRLAIVMILAFFVICMGDVPQNKYRSSIEYIYGFNQLNVFVDKDNIDYINKLYDRDDIVEIVLDYEYTVPYENVSDDGSCVSSSYEMAVWVLPENIESIKVEDFLAYGRYMENENEIIISDAMALELGEPKELLGETLHIDLYGGSYEMEIVGIFKELSTIEAQYFYNSGITVYDEKDMYDDRFAISAAITNKFLEDDNYFSSTKTDRLYTVYFESYTKLIEFYDEEIARMGVDHGMSLRDGISLGTPEVELSLAHVFNVMHKYMFPVAALIMVLAVLFYFQTQRTELMYNMKIFAVYQYLGYSMKRVKGAWILYTVFELVKVFVLSGIISVIITIIINVINRSVKFIPFEIFTYNVEVILSLLGIIVVIGALNAVIMLRKINAKTISENLVEQRDLL